MKLLIMVLAILFSTSVFAHGPAFRHVDRYGMPFYTPPGAFVPCNGCVPACGWGNCAPAWGNCGWGNCGPRTSTSWGIGINSWGGQTGGSFYFNQSNHQHFNGCGHSGWGGHNSQSFGGSINSWGGQTGGSLYFNQSQSNW